MLIKNSKLCYSKTENLYKMLTLSEHFLFNRKDLNFVNKMFFRNIKKDVFL